MASFIKIDFDVARALLAHAQRYSREHNQLTSTMAAALVFAGVTLLSSGMDDEQVRAVYDQIFDLTASHRAERNAKNSTVRS